MHFHHRFTVPTHGFIISITVLSTCFGRSSQVLMERGEEKCAGLLLFSEGCTGFNRQIIIYSFIFIALPSPDSCAYHKKIGIIFYRCQMLSSLFSTSVFVNIFLRFQLNIVTWFSKHTSLTGTFEKSIIPSDPCTLDKFLCPTMLLCIYRLYLQNLVLSTSSLSCCVLAIFVVHKHLWCLHLSCLFSLFYYISCE